MGSNPVKPFLYVLLLYAVTASAVRAGPTPPPGTAPLLFVRFQAPQGVRVTFYQGRIPPRTFATPVVVGLRPGYIYRIKLSGFPDQPKVNLFPSLEVRNTLRLPAIVRAVDHPAALPFTIQDVNEAQRGALLTKVVLLEDPEEAIPVSSTSKQPIELDAPRGEDPVDEARLHGRPLVVMRLGERDLTDEELACRGIPGTILFPGERFLMPAPVPPPLSFACLPVQDPFYGAKCPEGECLHDGGDTGAPLGMDRNGQLFGLDPSDTVASYTDRSGRRHLAISNRVCVCVPRFLIVRGELLPTGYQSIVGLVDSQIVQAQARLEGRTPPIAAMQAEALEGYRGRLKPSGMITAEALQAINRLEILNAYHLNIGLGAALGTEGMRLLTSEERTRLYKQMEFARALEQPLKPQEVESAPLKTEVVGKVEGVNVVANVQELRDITSCGSEAPEIPGRPLHLYKWASARSGEIGDVVTFFLKYSNVGGQPITNVAVTDSLTGRLEYIPGSAKSSRDAVFTTQENKAGSVILHWEVSGQLAAGASGTVSFQAKIR